MRTSEKARLLSAAATAALLALPEASHAQTAQTAQAAPPAAVEEITVTARRREETLQSTPISVSAVSDTTLQQLNITTPDKLSEITPNVSIAQGSGGIGGNTAFIRGVGEQDPLLTEDSPVGVYLDGIYLGREAGNNFDLIDLARVEVLRGPQGELYGRNTTGGAINLVTKDPPADFGVEGIAGAGSFGENHEGFKLDTGELGDSHIAGIIDYMHKDTGGYVTNADAPSSRAPGAEEGDAVWSKFSGEWDGFSADLTGDYDFKQGMREPFEVTSAYPLAQAYYGQSPSYGGQPFSASPNFQSNYLEEDLGKQTSEDYGYGLTMAEVVNPYLTVKSITGFRRWRADQPTTYTSDLRGPVVDFTSPTLYSVQPVSPFLGAQSVSQYQYSEELQAQGTIDHVSYTAGLYWFREHVQEFNPTDFTVVTPTSALSALGYPAIVGNVLGAEGLKLVGVNLGELLAYQGASESQAAYAQSSWKPPAFDDKLELTGGIRYTMDRKSIDQSSVTNPEPISAPINTLPIVPGPGRGAEADFHNFSFAVSASYQWTEQLMSYARISTGYKSGGFDARAGEDLLTGTSFPFTFAPEKATAYELGSKTELFDRKLRLNGSLFYTKYDNLQIPQYSGGDGFTPNADAHYQGFELEAEAVPVDNVKFDGSIGYVDPVYDKFLLLNPNTGITSDIKDSAQFPYVPHWTAHAGVDYTFPPLNFGTLIARTDYAYTSSRYFFATTILNPANDAIKDPGQHLLSARLILDDVSVGGGAKLEASLFAENLLNDQLRVAGIDFGPSIGIAGDNFGPPRLFGVEFRVKY